MLSQVATLLDDLHSTKSKLIVGATCNDVSLVDGSLRRPGRFTHEIFIPVPNAQERQLMIEAMLGNDDVSPAAEVAQVTPGYVASDIGALCQRLSLGTALKEALKAVPPSGFKQGTAGSVSVAETGWSDIGGLGTVKRDLQSALLWPALYPGHYRALDLQRPSGVLLYGPPGCGKTSIVKAMAGMAGATFFYVSAANIFSPYVGDSEKASLTGLLKKNPNIFSRNFLGAV